MGRLPRKVRPIFLTAGIMFLLIALSCIFDTLINQPIIKYDFLLDQKYCKEQEIETLFTIEGESG